MHIRTCITVFLVVLLHSITNASGEPSFTFVDGRWRGGIETGSSSTDFKECWASTDFSDGTNFTLLKRGDGNWYLLLSNADWQLMPSDHFEIVALVDFYPQQVRNVAKVESKTGLEIANLEQISLLGFIENGHTIDLTFDSLNKKYDLEGSAKAIQWIRNCFAYRN